MILNKLLESKTKVNKKIWLVDWLVILFNDMSTLLGYLMLNFVILYDVMCINILKEIISIDCFSQCG